MSYPEQQKGCLISNKLYNTLHPAVANRICRCISRYRHKSGRGYDFSSANISDALFGTVGFHWRSNPPVKVSQRLMLVQSFRVDLIVLTGRGEPSFLEFFEEYELFFVSLFSCLSGRYSYKKDNKIFDISGLCYGQHSFFIYWRSRIHM